MRFEDYTFTDNNNDTELRKTCKGNDDSNPASSNNKKHKENVFKMRNNPKEGYEVMQQVKASWRSQQPFTFSRLRMVLSIDKPCNIFS
jgi:hypothetical protein